MSFDFRVPEENPALAGLLAIIRQVFLVYGRFMNRPYGRGGSAISPKLSYHAPAALCGWPAGILWRADIPPMLALHQHGTGLAAQSAFPSEPLASFHQKFGQLIWR